MNNVVEGLKRLITLKRSVSLKIFNRNYPNGQKERN